MKKSRTPISAKSDINITPLIDVLLVLLVIFMTISPQVPKALDTAIPQPPRENTPQPLTPPPELIIVSVERDNVVRLNQQETMDKSALGARLQDLFSRRPEHTMFITADPDLEFNEVASVIDIAKGQGGAEKIGLMTARPQSPQPIQ